MNRREYEKLSGYMSSCMADMAHDGEHVFRVLYYALQIAKTEEKVDYDVLIAACLLHDIGRAEEFADPSLCHAAVGGAKAYDYLLSVHWPREKAAHVRDCILTHRFRADNPPESMEAKILFDSDKIDAAGALGIARTLICQGKLGEPIYSLCADGTVSDGAGDKSPSFFQEYRFKLEKLYEGFYTKRGRELALRRQSAAAAFYEEVRSEAEGAYQKGRGILGGILDE